MILDRKAVRFVTHPATMGVLIIVFLIGLDTSINQYVMTRPDYIFDRCVEQAVIDPENPFVVIGRPREAGQQPDHIGGASRRQCQRLQRD